MKKKIKKIKLFFYPLEEGGKGFNGEFTPQELKEMYKNVCKPCWELKYCPYGPLVEGYPLPPISKKEAKDHINYLKECLKSGKLGDGKERLDLKRRKWFEEEVNDFDITKYPDEIPAEVNYMSCKIFGHLCPVFFNAEGLTETIEGRRQTRSIPRDVIIRTVRRDDSTCQLCSKKILDKDIEIDHIIPLSRGGATIESNLRVLCKECNKRKSNKNPEKFLINSFNDFISKKSKK